MLVIIFRITLELNINSVYPKSFNGHHFLIYKGTFAWYDALSICNSQGLELSSPSSGFDFKGMQLHEGDWFVNVHRFWYNQSGPAFADGTLLASSSFGLLSSSIKIHDVGIGECFRFSNDQILNQICSEQRIQMRFSCALKNDNDFISTNDTGKFSCPAEWTIPVYKGYALKMCITQKKINSYNWNVAQSACHTSGGKLLSIRNDLEALWLEDYSKQFLETFPQLNNMAVLLDASKYCIHSMFCWSDGRPLLFGGNIKWQEGEPNNAHDPENCVEYSYNRAERQKKAGYNDITCSSLLHNFESRAILCRRNIKIQKLSLITKIVLSFISGFLVCFVILSCALGLAYKILDLKRRQVEFMQVVPIFQAIERVIRFFRNTSTNTNTSGAYNLPASVRANRSSQRRSQEYEVFRMRQENRHP